MTTGLQYGLMFVAQPDAKVLILGSMPGQMSLEKQQYYAHPRNAFWPVMARLCQFSPEISYSEKLIALQQHKIALWDVIQSCERIGSLDSNIKHTSIVTNNFADFFQHHPQIQHIFFNGSKAEQEYRRRIFPWLAEKWQNLPATRLPSTSPAMASFTPEDKLIFWQQIIKVIQSC